MKKLIHLFIIMNSFCIIAIKSNAQAPSWIWAKEAADDTVFKTSNSTYVDNNGSCYITGAFSANKVWFGSDTLFNSGSPNQCFFLVKYSNNGDVLWAKSALSCPRGCAGRSVCTDHNGNIYLSGSFYDSLRIDTAKVISVWNKDIFLAKFNSNGDLIWLKSYGSQILDDSYSITVGPDNYLYLTGTVQGNNIVFGGITLTGKGNDDSFIAKINEHGIVKWANLQGGVDDDQGTDMKVSGSGYIYLTGWFKSPSVTFNTATLVNSDPSGIRKDIFITKYDTSGNEIWAKAVGSSADDVSLSTAVDENDDFYITGYYESPSLSFGNITINNSGYIDMFLAKYNSSGNPIWVNTSQGEMEEAATSVIVDIDGDVYICGYFMGNSTYLNGVHLINRGLSDIFVAKYNTLGNILWVKYAGGTSVDKSKSLALDPNGNIYTTGDFYSPKIIFGTDTIYCSNGSAIFTAKLASTMGLDIFEQNDELTIYPNPFSYTATLQTKNDLNCAIISIYNLLGQQVKQIKNISKSTIVFSRDNLPSGIYFIRLTQDNKVIASEKLIIID